MTRRGAPTPPFAAAALPVEALPSPPLRARMARRPPAIPLPAVAMPQPIEAILVAFRYRHAPRGGGGGGG